MPLRHMPKGCSSPSAKLQIDFDWSKFGGGLEVVCNHAGILYIYLHFNVLTLCIFNVFYLYFRHGEANGHKIPPKSVRTAGGTPPCRRAGEGACIGEFRSPIQAPSPALRLAY